MSSKGNQGQPMVQEVLPKSGLIFSEKHKPSEILCKPKIMPLKSITLEKLEEMQRQMAEFNAETKGE
ncbi:cilia BBSome complex subunit 10 [Chloropicon roscoffensis]|uniref:Cilia BBSome complex subunit 10 n=1 Tax=Chloropicon roscoffensis TaxID=1461544 RepID=A0AAX4P395_9CHLO